MSESQNIEILMHMQTEGAITFFEALKRYRTMHLPRRIKDLKEKGHSIADEWVTNKRTKQRYKKYWLKDSDYGRAKEKVAA